MGIVFNTILLFCITLLCGIDVQAKGWRGIIPLHSSRSDVERMIGAPKSQGKFVSSYEFADAFVDIYYSSGPPCGGGLTNAWKVRRDIVVSVRVNPKKETRFDKIVTDTSKYQKTTDPLDRSLQYYLNEEEGLRYTVRENALSSLQDIASVDYLPERRQYHLKCSPAGASIVGLDLVPFEKYRSGSDHRQKAILDNFAVQLENEKQLTGLILIYSGNKKRASRIAGQIRNYLINFRGIERDRLTVKIGKQKTELSVELYLVPADKSHKGANVKGAGANPN